MDVDPPSPPPVPPGWLTTACVRYFSSPVRAKALNICEVGTEVERQIFFGARAFTGSLSLDLSRSRSLGLSAAVAWRVPDLRGRAEVERGNLEIHPLFNIGKGYSVTI